MADAFYVRAIWDDEAGVWVSESDIPGLVIEADTLGEFEALIRELAPELLADNAHLHHRAVHYRFIVDDRRELHVA